ncbi:MAG TPA: LPS export ABC transporter periplasmic protein LptC [Steroidobacteraceae bacterium]|nr:LPS export ABC transporter periplasmic protein LptC [Steroidobacteraceae bacterium]
MNWRWISLAALLGALVIGYGALVERNPAPAAGSTQAEQPGYYLKDAVITQTQQNGSVGLRLIADSIEQRQGGDDSITLDTVRVNYFQASPGELAQREWLLSARSGLVPANFRVVQLFGDVVLRPADAQPTAFLRADALAIDTQTNIAYSTSSPVHVRFGGHSMVVKSFRADLTNEKVRLESVNGRFDPQSQ